MDQVWPAVVALIAVIVFVVFWTKATLMLALSMALAILVAGWVLVTLVSGTGWITRLRLRIAALWH